MPEAITASTRRPLIPATPAGDTIVTARETTVTVDPTRDPFLYDHCFKGHPLLPAVVMMEIAAETASLCTGGRLATGIEGLRCLNGVRFFQPTPIDVRVRCAVLGSGALCRLSHDFRNRKGAIVDADRLCAELVVRFDEPHLEWSTAERFPVSPAWKNLRYHEESTSYLGPSLRGLQRVSLEVGGLWGEIIAPDPKELMGDRGTDGLQLPISTIDACLVAGILFAQESMGVPVALPLGLHALHVVQWPNPGETCLVRVQGIDRRGNLVALNLTLYRASGELLLHARHFTAGRVGSLQQPFATLVDAPTTSPPRLPR